MPLSTFDPVNAFTPIPVFTAGETGMVSPDSNITNTTQWQKMAELNKSLNNFKFNKGEQEKKSKGENLFNSLSL